MSERTIDWRRVARGVLFVEIGVFLLLTTTGVLPWSFWLELLTYWPVVLVAIGLRLVFERTRMPWAALVSPLLLLAVMAWVAGRGPEAGPVSWAAVASRAGPDTERWTLEGDLALVRLAVEGRSLPGGLLVDGKTTGGGHASRTSGSGDAVRVRLDNRRESIPFVVLPTRRETWELGLREDLPLGIDLGLALSRAELSLEALPLSGLAIDGAFNDLVVNLPAVGSDVRLRLDGAFNRAEFVVPDETTVRIRTDGFLNIVRGRPDAPPLEGPAYRLTVDGAFNQIVVRSRS